MDNKSEFRVNIKKDQDGVYRAWVEDQPHIRALSYSLDIVKLNIKECIEVWSDKQDPIIFFNLKE